MTEVIRYNGVKVSIDRLGSGRYVAQSGYGHGSGDTKAAAVAAVKKEINAAKRAEKTSNAASAKASSERRAKRAGKECTLSYCSGAIDTPAHRRTAKHRNAVAVRNAQRSGSYRA